MDQFSGKNVLVMGLGVHGGGLGVARFMASHGANVRVTDLRTADKMQGSIDALARDGVPVDYVLGEHREEDFRWADIVIRNPAVPRESPWLRLARDLGKPIEMEIGIFLKLCPAPVIGVTGTKGKSTTTTWTWEMVRRWKPGAILAGNLRVSALEALPLITENTPVVLELSSFQLEGLEDTGVSPHLAAVTNLSPDHLDRYKGMEDYGAAKKHIFTHQDARKGDWVVLNAADPVVSTWSKDAPAGVAWFGPDRPGGRLPGAFVTREGILWRAADNEPVFLAGKAEISLQGAHNLLNAACASALAILLGTPVEAVREALREFRGVADRMEYLGALGGVKFINDTTSTAPASTVAALDSIQGPVVLIAGGAKKNLDFAELAPVVAARALGVVLLDGTATDLMEREFREAGVNILARYGDFEDAVKDAWRAAPPGGTVLLSPGTASFGMFLNEFHRGERFREIVRALIAENPGKD